MRCSCRTSTEKRKGAFSLGSTESPGPAQVIVTENGHTAYVNANAFVNGSLTGGPQIPGGNLLFVLAPDGIYMIALRNLLGTTPFDQPPRQSSTVLPW